ncbi:MAG: hypothetical protein ACI9U2_002933 [Bradymonadia bacterium]|jgi:hypothetical protein
MSLDSDDSCPADVCGEGDTACAAWVAKDLLEGNTEKATCKFLTDDADYQKWLTAAKTSRAKAKAKTAK